MKIWVSGDHKWLAEMYGLSGAAGCYPCLYCMISKEEMRLAKAKRVPSYERDINTIILQNMYFMNEGGNLADAKKFLNCIRAPLLTVDTKQVFEVYF